MSQVQHRNSPFRLYWRKKLISSKLVNVHPQIELSTSTLIYNPFQSNEADYFIGSEFDPDLNFSYKQNLFSGFICNYYSEY